MTTCLPGFNHIRPVDEILIKSCCDTTGKLILHARVGLLMARNGRWGDRQVLPADWVAACTEPCPLNASYGLLWWLNGDRKLFPSAPTTSFFAIGVGRNVIWADPELDLVAVVRWIDRDAFDGFASALVASLA